MPGLEPLLIDGAICLQIYVTVFVALHDWVPLGRFNDVEAVRANEPPGRLIAVTFLSTAPFGFGAAESVMHASRFPGWLTIFLWISYAIAAYGLLRTWWAPYLLFEEPARAARYQAMHGRTHAFLPLRNGLRPNTLHVTVHLAIILMLADLAVMTFAPRGR
jgi:hypothetical protein